MPNPGLRWLARVPQWLVASFCLGLVGVNVPAAQAAPFAYVTNQYSDNVSVIDLASNTVVATVPTGGNPGGVAVNATGTKVYVANYGSSYVSVITTATNTVTANIFVAGPSAVAINPAGTRLYVTSIDSGSIDQPNSVNVIDTATNTLITKVSDELLIPIGLAVSPDGTRVYVTNAIANPNPLAPLQDPVWVIDTTTNSFIDTVQIPFGYTPREIVVNSTGKRVYVAYQWNDTVTTHGAVAVIDTETNELVGDVNVGQLAKGLGISPDGSRVYATTAAFNTVAMIDTRCNDKVATVAVLPYFGSETNGVAVHPDGTRIYAVSGNDNSVKVIDVATKTVIDSIPVGNTPSSIAVAYNPGAAPPPDTPVPAQITGIEVTQSVQDLANSVPLVLFKRTFVRVYVKADALAVAGVTARLSGRGSYMTAGGEVNVPLGSLVPSNSKGPLITVRPEPKRSIVDDSFLFELPWNWTAFEGLRLHATLSMPPAQPLASCLSELASAPVNEFRTYTEFKVAYVRMSYQLPIVPPNAGGPPLTTTPLEQRMSESWMRAAYPVSKLTSAPDFVLFDPFLGGWVDQSSPSCQISYEPDKRNRCAYRRVSTLLAGLEITSGFMGDADMAYGLIPQDPTGAWFTRGACCEDSVGAGAATNFTTTSHEGGHFLGRKHPVEAAAQCGHSADDPNYPYFFTFIAPPLSDPDTALTGFLGGDPAVGFPQVVLPPRTTVDLMSYCPPTRWISDYTYKALAISLEILHPDIGAGEQAPSGDAPQGSQQLGDWLLVFGQITADLSTASFINIQRVDRIFSQPERPPGAFSIRLLDIGDATLADYPFDPVADEDGLPAGGGDPNFSFGHVVPWVAGTREVRIIDTSSGDAVLASIPVSSNAPEVDSVAAQGPPDPATGLMPLTWTANDADGDPLTFDLYFTRDEGDSLRPLMVGLSELSAEIDTRPLGGGNTRIRVVANDGLQTGFSDSDIIVLPNKPPQPRILSPGDDAHVYLGQVINLDGEANDPQDGAIDPDTLVWSSELGPLGTGARLSVSDLPVGVHLLTLAATNSEALTATTSVSVTVDGNITTHGPTLTAGPGQIGWHVVEGEVELQTEELYIGNSGSGNLAFTATSGAPWLMLSATAGTAPATLILTANPAGFAEGVSEDTSVTLKAPGFPDQEIVIPVRLGVGNTWVVGDAPKLIWPNFIYRDGFE